MLQHERDDHFVFGEKRDKMFARPIALQLQAWKASGFRRALCTSCVEAPCRCRLPRYSRSSRFNIFQAGSISIIKKREYRVCIKFSKNKSRQRSLSSLVKAEDLFHTSRLNQGKESNSLLKLYTITATMNLRLMNVATCCLVSAYLDQLVTQIRDAASTSVVFEVLFYHRCVLTTHVSK